MSAEAIITFLLRKLRDMDNELSLNLMRNIKARTDERTNDNVMLLLKILKDSSRVPSKATVTFAQRIMKRIFPSVQTEEAGPEAVGSLLNSQSPQSQRHSQSLAPVVKSLQEELDEEIKSACEEKEDGEDDDFKTLKSGLSSSRTQRSVQQTYNV